jgi:hypothetical protein
MSDLPWALLQPSQITYPGAVTSSFKDAARGPERAPVRAWRAWGDRAQPLSQTTTPVRGRSKPQQWIFRECPAMSGAKHRTDAQDGRPALDEGHGDNADRLLDRLRAVHGQP